MSRSTMIRRSVATASGLVLAGLIAGASVPANAAVPTVTTAEQPVQGITQPHPIDLYLTDQGKTRTSDIFTSNYTDWAYDNVGNIVIDNSEGGAHLRFTPPTTGIEWYVAPGEIITASGQPGHDSIIVQKNTALGVRYLATPNHDIKWGQPVANQVTDAAGNQSQVMEKQLDSYGRVAGTAFHSVKGGAASIVEGNFYNLHHKLGSNNVVGLAKSDKTVVTSSTGASATTQSFTKGYGFYETSKGLFVTKGAIGAKYVSFGGVSKLGLPTMSEQALGSGGVYQQFEKGRVYWKSGVGAYVIDQGDIGKKYIALGGSTSSLGYPTSDKKQLSSTEYIQYFENGYIYWKSGAITVSTATPVYTR